MLFYELYQEIITKCWTIEITKILRATLFETTASKLEKIEFGKTSFVDDECFILHFPLKMFLYQQYSSKKYVPNLVNFRAQSYDVL